MRLELEKNQSIVLNENSYLTIDKESSYQITIPENTNVYLDLKITSKCDINIEIKEHANVEILAIDNAIDVNKVINIANGASLTGIIGHFGSGAISDLVNLNSEHASCELKMVSMANNNKKQDIVAKVMHNAPETKGIVKAYCVSDNEGKIIFDGINKIHKGNRLSVSSLHIRGMILSDSATIAANPALLIDEFDVKANHGATIGKISDEGLYYLMSRGISKNDATLLIINGFLTPIIENIKDDESKEYFKSLSLNKI